jgi:hypothetical protein
MRDCCFAGWYLQVFCQVNTLAETEHPAGSDVGRPCALDPSAGVPWA